MIDELIAETRIFKDCPWKHQGRTRKGIDCVGLLIVPCKKLGIKIKEISGYARKPDGVQLKQIMDTQPSFTKVEKPYLPGDIVLFRIRKEPQHIALLSGTKERLSMIHAFNGGNKKVVEHIFADYWINRIVAVYRLNNELY